MTCRALSCSTAFVAVVEKAIEDASGDQRGSLPSAFTVERSQPKPSGLLPLLSG